MVEWLDDLHRQAAQASETPPESPAWWKAINALQTFVTGSPERVAALCAAAQAAREVATRPVSDAEFPAALERQAEAVRALES